jgi:RNA methyltransferase, TrmH family
MSAGPTRMTTPCITSRQNPRVKDAVRLRSGRGRLKQGRFVIDGAREIARAVAAGIRPVEAFVEEGGRRKAEGGGAELVTALQRAGAEILPVTEEVFEKLCFGERDDVGVVVVAETPERRLDSLQLPAAPLVAVVEGIEKPGNLGAILRSADAAGVDAVIVADGATDLFNPNTIRASLGTVFRANVVEARAAETIAWLTARGLRIVAARPGAELLYTDVGLRDGVAIVLGSEAAGLSNAWRGADVVPVRLPMCGVADSLNVSTAAAVLFYEAVRQRGQGTRSEERGAS